ncbi:carbohydrate kinase family protein [Candidatus Peregrinibacteria bacterium]|nr:carbohydrate kinase family protein [Candidatus Peregrinibacteria bacterium]
MKKVVVTGSIAYDHLLTFDGEFKDTVLPEQLSNLSISFLASSHQTNFGGCGANIAFSLKMLGEEPLLLGVVGNDFEPYANWLDQNGISRQALLIDHEKPSAVANVLSDQTQNQIAIFSPAAMGRVELLPGIDAAEPDELAMAIISPEMPERMKYYAGYFKKMELPFIFDPGQAMPALSSEDLLDFIDAAFGVMLNEYEAEMLAQKTGLSLLEIASRLEFLVCTLGSRGTILYHGDNVVEIPAAKDLSVVDPTGCGDAFRAGFIKGLVNSEGLKRACELGTVAASFSLEREGTQNHLFTPEEFEQRLVENFA